MFFKPTIIAEDVTAIDLERLRTLGVKGFIFDLDNTLMAPHTGLLERHIEEWLALIHSQGFKSAIVSNNKQEEYIRKAEEVLNIPCIGNAGKPRVEHLLRAMEAMGLQPTEVAVVGDRPLTDIWGGFRMGAHTILVESLSKARESRLIRFLRWMEWRVIRQHENTIGAGTGSGN